MQNDPPAIHSLKIKFWIFTALSILALVLMRFWSNGLDGSTIVGFEMAKTVPKASELMLDWGANVLNDFLNSVYADFIFLACYGTALFYGSRFFGHLSGSDIMKKAGDFFSFLALLAAACDLLENIGMLYTIKQRLIGWVVHFTYDMALVKFSLLFIVALFIVICLFFWGIDKLSSKSERRKVRKSGRLDEFT